MFTYIITGKNVELSDEAEEVALFYAGVLGSDHTQDEVFNKNFFNDFLGVLKENPPVSLNLIVFIIYVYFYQIFYLRRKMVLKLETLRNVISCHYVSI